MDTLCKNKNLIKLFLINISVSIGLILFLLVSGGYAFQEADIITSPSQITGDASSIREYRKKVNIIDSQIFSLKENMKWLGLKINRIKDFNRHVPEVMEDSMASKAHIIESLGKVRKRLIRNIEALLEKKGSDSETFLPVYKKEKKIVTSNVKENNADHKKKGVILKKGNTAQKKADFVKELRLRVKKCGLGDWVEFAADGECCRLVTRLPILFASGSAKIADTYKLFFKKLATCIRNYDVRVMVDGYADIDAIHNKKYPSNFELGAARAANIVHELIKYGVKPSIFKIGTTGKYRFKAKGMSKKKTIERRADLTIIFTA